MFELVATRFADENILKAISLTHTGRHLDYNQVVLVGDGMDSRPYRLPWPMGTVIYLVAPGDCLATLCIVHRSVLTKLLMTSSHLHHLCLIAGHVQDLAHAALKAADAHVPRGSLLRRVPADLQSGASFQDALERAGYRGDRLSVWVLQVQSHAHFSRVLA